MGKNNWLVAGYIRGDINTSDGLAKSLSSVNLGNLLANDISRIATSGEKEIRRKAPSAQRYIVYPELFRVKGFEN